MKLALFAILACGLCATATSAEVKKLRRTKTVPGPYPAIIKLPRVPEAPDRPATSVLLYDTELSGRELAFLQAAHETGQHQLALATMAKTKAQSEQVKTLAAALADTQAEENRQVARLASLKSLSLPRLAERELTQELATLEGAKFDKRWIERLVAVNEAAQKAYESGTQCADSEIKAFATGMLPLAQAKLGVANRLAGKSTTAAPPEPAETSAIPEGRAPARP